MSTSRRIASASPRVKGAIGRLSARIAADLHDGRRARRWTLRELASRAGMSVSGVQSIEAGEIGSIESYARLADALGLRLDITLADWRRREPTTRRAADPVHSAMGDFEAGHLRRLGFPVAIDEPYQHFQFAGRADLLAWDIEHRGLLHIENRTRFPDLQESAGAYNAKRAYLGAVMAKRVGVASWRSETHVMAGLWSSEVLHVVRLRIETFRSLCPDEPDAFVGWWKGDPPTAGRQSICIVIDPIASARQRPFVGIEDAMTARPRVRGYAEAAAKLSA